MSDADATARRLQIVRMFSANVPHNLALGMRVVDVAPGEAVFELPYKAELVGNPDTGVLHGGVITALLDATSGSSVFAALDDWRPIATLDLRIDYLRPAEVGKTVVCRAHCYKQTRNVAFTRAVAYHESADDPIAQAVGTFMLGTKGPKG